MQREERCFQSPPSSQQQILALVLLRPENCKQSRCGELPLGLPTLGPGAWRSLGSKNSTPGASWKGVHSAFSSERLLNEELEEHHPGFKKGREEKRPVW